MILKSEIRDASTLSINCAKARIGKDETIEIPDEYWREKEVQDAVRLGFVSLVGQPPTLPEIKKNEAPERKLRFASRAPSKIAFECVVGRNDDGTDKKWKEYVAPGDLLSVPESALSDPQIQNAIAWKMIEPLDKNPEQPPAPVEPPQPNVPVQLEELTKNDILEDKPEKKKRNKPKLWAKKDVVEQEPKQVEESPKQEATLDPFLSILTSSKKDKRTPSSEEF
jgi:hypothetical protein